jgi:hypothetical protein
VTGDSSGTDVGRSSSHLGDPSSLDIFICYRREDAAANAGRLADALVERFGRNSVFMDVDTIEPGVDFTEAINRAIGHCDVLIALIGPHWLEAANVRGRRLDDPQDFVRLEIEAALDRNIRVVPTLVGGAAMPQADDLPGSLIKMATRNAVELSDKRFRSDLQALLEPLERIAQQKRESVLPPRHSEPVQALPGPFGQSAFGVGSTPSPVAGPHPTEAAHVSPVGAPPHVATSPPSPAVASKGPRKGRKMLPLVALIVALVLIITGASALALNRLSKGVGSQSSNSSSKSSNLLAVPDAYVGTWKGSGHQFSPPTDFAITMTIKPGQIGAVVGSLDRPTLGCQKDLLLDKAANRSITMTEQGGAYCYANGQGVAPPGSKVVASLSGTALDWKEFAADPSSSSATATATLAQASSGPIAGTSNLLAVPASYVGTWRGSGHQFLPSADFAITMTLQPGQIGAVVGSLDRPTLGCQKDLLLDKATTRSITMTEQGGAYCYADGQGVAPPGSKIVASLSGATLDWKEFAADPSSSSAAATAILAQGSSGPIAGTSNVLAVPDGFVGTWKGSGHVFLPSADFAITLTLQPGQIGSVVGSLDRPTLGCQKDLILDKATDQSITMTEQGGAYCYANGQGVAPAGSKVVASINGATLDWKEYSTDPSSSTAAATGTLNKSS